MDLHLHSNTNSNTNSLRVASLSSKWTIFGGHGWIGQQFCRLLEQQQIPYEIPSFRMDDTKTLCQYLDQVHPSRVVSFIGRTHGGNYTTIDYLEQGRPQLVENVRDNLYAPFSCALSCHQRGIHFTYLGTGCIFQYDSDHPYPSHELISPSSEESFHEEDLPNFFGSGYSIVKGFTDRLFHLLPTSTLQLRIRMPINEDLQSSRNFITKILHYPKICSLSNSMTVLPDVLPIMVDMIQQEKTGTYNLTNPGTITHNQILDMYTNIIDPSFTYENFSPEEQSLILKADRSNNCLDTTRLEKEFFILPIYQSIQRLLKRIKKRQLIASVPSSICLEKDLYYQGTSYLITGGYGFIGSNYLHHLVEKDRDHRLTIINVDKKSYCSLPSLVQELATIIHYEMDINDTDEILNLLQKHRIDTVVHFAAQSHVDLSFGNSISFTMDNTRGTHSLLEASRRYGKLLRFLHISTDEVYGETLSNTPYTETSLPNPTNPYAATKIAAEFLVQSYFHCFELPILIIRGNNVYGPRQFPEKIIPKCILQLLQNKKCTLHGNGLTRRNFVHVSDVCHALDTVLSKGHISEVYNIGTENEHSVIDIVQTLVQHFFPHHSWRDHVMFIEDRHYNDFTYRIDASKLCQLGWTPSISFTQGLESTIEFYREHLFTIYQPYLS